MINDLVSIITPVYNAEKFIVETIKSIQAQTYKNWELLLIDDCSTDNSKKIINTFSKEDLRIKYISLTENSGAAVARNTGIEKADGQYIAFIDSDDQWESQKLEVQINFMKNKNIGFTFTAYEMISEDGKSLNKFINVPKTIDYNQLLKNTIIGCSTVVIDRNQIGDFRMPLVRKGQDTATWLSILKTGKIAYGIEEYLVKYRIVEGSISSNKIDALKRTWNTYYNIEKLGLIKSSYVFICYVSNAIKKRM